MCIKAVPSANWHSGHTMLENAFSPFFATLQTMAAGAVLWRRGDALAHMLHLAKGRVVLGLLRNGHMTHQLDVVQGSGL